MKDIYKTPSIFRLFFDLKSNLSANLKAYTIIALFTLVPMITYGASAHFISNAFSQVKTTVERQLLIANATDYATVNTPSKLSSIMPPCPGGSGVIGGVAFQDFNHNGDNDQVGTIQGLQVAIFSCDTDGNSTLVSTTTTDENGQYFFDGLTDGESYRVQFFVPSSLDFLSSGSGSGEAGTDVQFVTSPSCDAHVGYLDINDYCEEDPYIVAACYVNGDPLAPNSGSADEDVLVAFRYSSTGNDPKIMLAKGEEMGSTYGLAYDKATQHIFAAAFIKRHVGLGPLGLGGIYRLDWSDFNNPVVEPLVDVSTLGIDVGTMLSNSERGLSANPGLPNNDPLAYDAVGKMGLGGMDISGDGSTLWFINLHTGRLHSLVIDSDDNVGTAPTSSDLSTFNLPNSGCSGGSLRPFAVKMHQGKVYVGAVCDAAMSQNEEDLEAIVYQLNGNSFTEVLRYDLDYDKGYTTFTNDCEEFPGWYPWRADLPPACSNNGIFRVYPTPILSDLAFAEDGDLIMGFTDRMGHQIGFKNYPLEGVSPLLQTISGGDMLRANNNNGTYELENNGTVGDLTSGGAGNMQGPGGGEFYYRDVFEGPIDNLVDPVPHTETSQGGLALVPGQGEVLTTALDPYSTLFNAGGVNWMNNMTGEVQNPGFVLYRTSNSDISTFSKANGLGDITPLCGLAPLEIGSYVWTDENENGLQDACEPAFDNINVALYDTEGNILATTQTDENGEFYFNDRTPNFDGIMPNTEYVVVVGTEGDFNVASGVLMDAGTLTQANVAGQADADLLDSDGTLANETVSNGAVTGLPHVQITTGGPGWTSHINDFGFTNQPPEPVTVSGEVFIDENGDGIHNSNEGPIAGVTVQLYHADGTLADETTTDIDGNYIFTVPIGGVYYIQFDTNANVDGTNYDLTLQNQGDDDTVDSDPDPSTGSTMNFPVVLNTEGVTNVDAGYQAPEPVTVMGFVFLDENGDGINNNNEGPFGGITVQLYHEDGTLAGETITNADGSYSFSVEENGVYYVQFDTNPSVSGTDYELTLQNQGDDDSIDSDADPITGITTTFVIVLNGDDPMNIDAGYQEVIQATASIGDLVFKDCNENGVQDNNETGIANVEITLSHPDGQESNTTTDANGVYGFSGLEPGAYQLSFSLPANSGLEFSSNMVNDAGETGNINLDEGEIENDIDIAVLDVVAPEFTGTLPQDMTVEDCDSGNLPTAPTLSATDNCDENVEITLEETTDNAGGNNGCAGATIVRTWTAIDDCGNSVSHTQRISLNDNEAPTFDGNLPQDMELDCSDTPPTPPTVTASDNCDNDVEVTLEGLMNDNDGSCVGRSMVRTWTATDDCGNSIVHTQTITFVDNTAPTFNGNLPGDLSGEDCTANDLPNPPTVTASDDCDDDVEITFDESLLGGNVDGCAGNTLVRTWTATDDCGNSVSHSQTIVFGDDTPPIFTGVLPANMNGVECSDFDLNNPPTLMATDNCDPSVFISFSQEIEENPSECAGGTVTRTWIATDDCGNSTAYTQTITFDDNTAPEITGVPEDVTVECDDIPGMPLVKGIDDCGGDVELVFTETQQGDCPIIITRTWTAFDNCGNSSTDSQIITVIDTIAPIVFYNNPYLVNFEDGDTLIVSCDNVPVLTNLDVTVFDNCDANPETEFVDFIVNSTDCLETGYLAYMFCGWVVTDDCGNVTQLTIHILVEDNTPPVLEGVPDDVVVGPDGELPTLPTVTASDNCDDNVHIDFDQEVMTEDCGSVVKRTWTATDDCGNVAIDVQIIVLSADCECPSDIITNVDSQDAGCGLENGVVSIDVSGSPSDYIITWTPNIGTSNAQDTERTDLPAGVYIVQVEFPFSADCFEKVVVEVEGEEPVNPNVDVKPVTCPGGNDGRLESDDGRTYTISQNGTEIGTTPVFNILAGTYTISFENSDGCATAIDVIVPEPPALEVSADQADVTCAGGDGAISLTVNGGTSPYSFAWTDAVSTTSFANNLEPGNYGITVTDAAGCTNEVSLSIGEDCECDLALSAIAEDATCGMSNGTVMLTTSGSIFGNLIYTWSPDVSSTNSATSLAAGTYNITVEDTTSGCEAFTSITIESTNLPQTPDVSLHQPSCAGECDGSITADNNRVYNIMQDGTVLGQTPLDGLCAGTYTINYGDDNSCNVSMNVTLTEPTALTASSSIEPDSCDLGLGSIQVSVSGGTTPYTYDWTPDVSSTNVASGLNTGTYAVIITDDNGCTFEMSSITVGETDCEVVCDLSLSSSITQDSCEVGQGAISIGVNGGTAPFSYEWSDNVSTTATAAGLDAGMYSVTVTDANDCSAEMSNITVGNIDCEVVCDLTITSSHSNASCGENNGTIEVTVANALGNLTYNWNPDVSDDATASDLEPGVYMITAIDNMTGCVTETMVTIEQVDMPDPIDATTTNLSCPGTNDGSITSNDGRVYDVRRNNALIGQTPINGLGVGTYTLSYADNEGCMVSLEVTATAPTPLSLEAVSAPDTCDTGVGQITFNVSGGTAPYIYQLAGEASTDNAVIGDLSGGSYDAIVTDANGCSLAIEGLIVNNICPCSIFASATAFPDTCDMGVGVIELELIGATEPITYNWSDGINSNSSTVTGLNSDLYHVTATDANGCTIVLENINLINICPCSLEATATVQGTTCGESNGSISIAVEGALGNLVYDWTPDVSDTNSASDLPAGDYHIAINDDATPCMLELNITIPGTGAAEAPDASATHPICPEDGGTIVSNDNRQYRIFQDGEFFGFTPVNDLEGGTYTVTYLAGNGCSQSIELTIIDAPTEWDVDATVTPVECDSNGSISLSVSGANGDYTYLWEGNIEGSNEATDLDPGDYDVTITDGEGCTFTLRDINVPDDCFQGALCEDLIVEVIDQQYEFCNGSNGFIEVAVSGNEGTLTYDWAGSNSTTHIAEDLTAGTYSLTVTDAATGCSVELTENIGSLGGPEVPSVIGIPQSCHTNDDGAIYSLDGRTYNIMQGNTSLGIAPATTLSPGIYTVFITDSNGCSSSVDVEVGAVEAISIAATTVVANCGASDGSIMLDVSGGRPPYNFFWQANVSTTQEATNLPTGTYEVTISDDNDCQITESIIVDNNCFVPDCSSSSFDSNQLIVEETSGLQCVPLNMANLLNHEVYLDGDLYSGSLESCLMDSVVSYSYTSVFQLDGGTYDIQWTNNGQTHTGMVYNMYELSDSMNIWDAVGNWSNDPGQHILLGGQTPFTYGDLVIKHSAGSVANIAPFVSGERVGVTMDLGAHSDVLVLRNADGCSDTLSLTTPEEAEAYRFQYVNFTLDLTDEFDGEDVLLTWMTINEPENGRFYIEHSLDKKKFRTLPKMIPGKGPANEVNVYQERHEHPHVGWNYYRIVFLDGKGNASRTEILKIFFKPVDGEDVYVYPNPFVNETTIDFLNPLEEEATVQLIDVWGQVLRTDVVPALRTKHILDVSEYPNGIYFIFINYNKHRRATHRIIKED